MSVLLIVKCEGDGAVCEVRSDELPDCDWNGKSIKVIEDGIVGNAVEGTTDIERRESFKIALSSVECSEGMNTVESMSGGSLVLEARL